MRVTSYCIFSGFPETPLWLEAVEELSAARVRMEQHAKLNPGPYFIYCTATSEVVAHADTTPRQAHQVAR